MIMTTAHSLTLGLESLVYLDLAGEAGGVGLGPLPAGGHVAGVEGPPHGAVQEDEVAVLPGRVLQPHPLYADLAAHQLSRGCGGLR